MTDAAGAVARAYESDWARIVSSLIRITHDWELAEDATSDAFVAALQRWQADGVPDNPAAWLQTAARNRAIDLLRRSTNERAKLAEKAVMDSLTEPTSPTDPPEDDRLRLIFTCCHPALELPARVALTLRTVGGLAAADIAQAFLVPEATMAQRLVRARRKIANAGIPYVVPAPEALGARLPGVLAVIYLVFNQGYSGLSDVPLASTALGLASQLSVLMPTESEVRGLFALLLFQHSRRDARTDADGALLTLEEQDRTRWHRDEIERGVLELAAAPGRGPYVLQAAIAQCHATASSAGTTDWRQIVALYDELATVAPSHIVDLNRAVALGMRDGPDAGLAELAKLAEPLRAFRLLSAAQADMFVRAGRITEAAPYFEAAIEQATSDAERAQLQRRLAQIREPDAGSP